MKKFLKIFSVFILASCLFTFRVYAQNENKIVDNANLLTQKQIESYTKQANSLIEKHSCDIVVVTSNNIGSKSAQEYADDFFDYNGYGIGKNKDGIILLIAMDKRKVYLSTSGKAINAFSDKKISEIINLLVAKLKKNDFSGTVQEYLNCVDETLIEKDNFSGTDQEYSNYVDKTLNKSKNKMPIYFGIGIGSIGVSFVILMFIRYGMHTARKNNYAKKYIKEDSLVLSKEKDIFLYSRVSQSRRSDDSGSSSSGSSTHTSSSGSSHGGGGGSF